MRRLFFVLVAMLCASCASSPPDRVPLSGGDFGVPDSTMLVQSGDLRISPLDMLDIKVFGSGEISGPYQVDPSGEIKFPLIGAIGAKGYTTFELAAMLESRLREKYLQDPLVTVRITEVNGQQFTIEGAVGKPGMYPVRGPLTLLQALAQAGGPTPNANLDGILIFRRIEGERKAARFDLRMVRSGEVPDPLLYGNDLVIVYGREGDDSYDVFLRSIPVIGMFTSLFLGGR
jgi:polysaccharide biosynthesis/export protein